MVGANQWERGIDPLFELLMINQKVSTLYRTFKRFVDTDNLGGNAEVISSHLPYRVTGGSAFGYVTFFIYANNEPKSCLQDLGDCRDNERNSQSVFLSLHRKFHRNFLP